MVTFSRESLTSVTVKVTGPPGSGRLVGSADLKTRKTGFDVDDDDIGPHRLADDVAVVIVGPCREDVGADVSGIAGDRARTSEQV